MLDLRRRRFIRLAALLAILGPPAAALAAGGQVAQAPSGPPIKIGWLVALTGPNSAPGIGFDRGIKFAADEINKAGGVKGRPVEVVTRDTQGDPTKAVNAAIELISQQKVEFTIGPTNSGEGLATTPVIARYGTPSLVLGVVDRLIDPEKYGNAFRLLPSNTQWTQAAHNYVLKTLKRTKVAIIGDSTGYGTTTVELSEKELREAGATITYKALIEANQTDVSADIQKAKASGAEVLLVWSDSAGMNSRLLNARADAGWDVPIVGHPALGSGSVKALLAKPENWEKVYIIGYRSMSYDKEGRLPERSQKFLDAARAAGVQLDDTTLWWVAGGHDTVQLIRHAIEAGGSSKSADVWKAWESTAKYPGVFGTYTYSPKQHNGYPTDDVVMNEANSFRNGAFRLAPGYE